MNASQGVDLLMGGLINGLNEMKETRRVEAAIAAEDHRVATYNQSVDERNAATHQKNVGILNQWVDYAHEMEEKNAALMAELESLKAIKVKNKKLESQVSELGQVQAKNAALVEDLIKAKAIQKEYVEIVTKRVNALNDRLQRVSAHEEAYKKMRDRLIDELESTNDETNPDLLDPTKRLEMHEEDCKYFMDNNDVRERVPRITETPTVRDAWIAENVAKTIAASKISPK